MCSIVNWEDVDIDAVCEELASAQTIMQTTNWRKCKETLKGLLDKVQCHCKYIKMEAWGNANDLCYWLLKDWLLQTAVSVRTCHANPMEEGKYS